MTPELLLGAMLGIALALLWSARRAFPESMQMPTAEVELHMAQQATVLRIKTAPANLAEGIEELPVNWEIIEKFPPMSVVRVVRNGRIACDCGCRMPRIGDLFGIFDYTGGQPSHPIGWRLIRAQPWWALWENSWCVTDPPEVWQLDPDLIRCIAVTGDGRKLKLDAEWVRSIRREDGQA